MKRMRLYGRGDDGSVMSLERVFVHASATPPCCSMTRRLFFFLSSLFTRKRPHCTEQNNKSHFCIVLFGAAQTTVEYTKQ